MRSHFEALLIESVVGKIMGGIQKRLEDGTWELPSISGVKGRSSSAPGMEIPVLALAYEAQVYLRLGRRERVELLLEAASRTTQDVQP